MNEACGRPADAGLARSGSSAGLKVRQGKVGANKAELTAAARAAIAAKWADVLGAATGHATYDDLRRSVNAELRRPFPAAAAGSGAAADGGDAAADSGGLHHAPSWPAA